MKIVLAIVVAVSLLISCNTADQKGKATATEPITESHAEHSAPANGLSLNNGVKWKSDKTTWLNVSLLQKIVSGPKKESLEDYLKIAGGLQLGLNKMVSECKIKGADHEALHHWLEPLMEKTTALKNSNSMEAAAKICDEIENQLNLFSQYFE